MEALYGRLYGGTQNKVLSSRTSSALISTAARCISVAYRSHQIAASNVVRARCFSVAEMQTHLYIQGEPGSKARRCRRGIPIQQPESPRGILNLILRQRAQRAGDVEVAPRLMIVCEIVPGVESEILCVCLWDRHLTSCAAHKQWLVHIYLVLIQKHTMAPKPD